MIENKQKEEISLAYLQAVCAKVGITVEVHKHDGDGIDGILKKTVRLPDGRPYDPTISFQLKSTRLDCEENESEIYYDLKIKNYNDLRRESSSKKFLFVHFFPESFDDSLVHSTESLQILRCMYWINGDNFEEIKNNTSVRVKLPKTNVASPDKLDILFQKVAEEEVA